MRQERQVKSVILETIKKQKMLSAGILTAVIGAVVAALIPPLILAKEHVDQAIEIMRDALIQ